MSSALVAQGLRSACRRIAGAARGRTLSSSSVSSARAQEATRSHLFRIGGYSIVDKRVPTGEPVVSAPFLVGCREWELGFYPNGIMSPDSVGAVLMPKMALGKGNNSAARSLWGDDPVAEYKVSILDHAGNQVYARSVGLRPFSYSMAWGSVQSSLELLELQGTPEVGGVLGPAIVNLVARKELRRGLPRLLDNDCLSVRCDVTALDLVDMDTDGGLRQ